MHWVYSCHSCRDGVHDYVDLYRLIKGLDLQAAIAELSGFTPLPAKPHLRVVRAPVLQTSAEKLTADQVRKVWTELGTEDGAGESYLEGRRLRDAVALGYVRFALETSENGDVRAKALKNYRVGLLLSSLARPAAGRSAFPHGARGRAGQGPLAFTKGHTKGVYFGRPGEVLGARCVVVTEGLADSLAARLWVKNEPDTAVVGVPGAGNVAALADALDDAGVDITGQLWVLLAQHDRGKRGNTSLAAFVGLKAKLQTRGADVVLENEPPGDEKDWAKSWQLEQLGEWPPTQVKRFLGGNSAAGDTGMSRATGAAIWHSAEAVEPDHLGKDLTSLTYLLSDNSTRVPICGRGEWRLNEMTDEVEYAGAALQRGDYTRIRRNIEGFRSGLSNKRLQFAELDVRAVAYDLAERKRYAPVREDLARLGPHDNVDWWRRCGLEAMGLDEQAHGLELTYLRLWALSAVARVYEPGCQVDTVLVLQGGEGQHKSRFFQERVPERRLFVRYMGDLSNEWKSVEAMRRGWIVELDEMASLLRARDYAEVLAFVARDVDTYAPKNVREATAVPRALCARRLRQPGAVPCRRDWRSALLGGARAQRHQPRVAARAPRQALGSGPGRVPRGDRLAPAARARTAAPRGERGTQGRRRLARHHRAVPRRHADGRRGDEPGSLRQGFVSRAERAAWRHTARESDAFTGLGACDACRPSQHSAERMGGENVDDDQWEAMQPIGNKVA